jgi:hypothetical protein
LSVHDGMMFQAREGGGMQARYGSATAALVLAAALAGGLAVACGGTPQPTSRPSPSPSATTTTLVSCGKSRTAAHVPVEIAIARGHVSCSTARAVERLYASAIIAGRAPGNGGGGPVKVGGWTCQGFTTPVVLATGNASKCVRNGDEILEILPSQ